jgi:hypothetical protein
MMSKRVVTQTIASVLLLGVSLAAYAQTQMIPTYDDLLELFAEWREFESPPLLNGAPDYTVEQFEKRQDSYLALRERLDAFVIDEWPIPQQVDWHLVRAEMNGYDFNRRILRPWERDPAFYNSVWTYRSDVPGHEGPTHHAVVELWTYEFPLSDAEQERLTRELGVVPPLMKQAQRNLTGNARDLWITGIRDIRQQRGVLDELQRRVADSASGELKSGIQQALAATDELIAWLETEADSKTGPSGIGKDNYTWYQQNVHLVPLTWEDEVRLLREYDALAEDAVNRIMRFLEDKNIVTVTDYMEPALREHMGAFVPEEQRHFFWITAHYDPAPLFTHFWHWFELARMDLEPHPSPIRQGTLLYNIFDSRNEGTATGVEEMFMHAGLYDDSPRSRELVWILLAQRAARGLGSLYAHANEMTMEEAGQVHMDWTPRGWMKTEKELLIFEQHLYLRQPGYGTSYVTGKYLLERTLADYARQVELRGEEFELRDFFDRLNAIDSIPISLGRWELTGLDDEASSPFSSRNDN